MGAYFSYSENPMRVLSLLEPARAGCKGLFVKWSGIWGFLATAGVFTPQKLANATNQLLVLSGVFLCFSGESVADLRKLAL